MAYCKFVKLLINIINIRSVNFVRNGKNVMWRAVKSVMDKAYTKLSTVSVDNKIKLKSAMMLRRFSRPAFSLEQIFT